NHPALLTALTVIINGEDSKLGLTVRLANKAHTTWSPSIFFTGAANCTLVGSALSLSALSTDPTANKFGDPALAMTDLEYFDCLFIDANGDVTAKTWCSCSDYRVEIWQRGQDAHYASGGSQNLWKGTISSVNGSAGTATVTLDDTTNFSDSANDYVMFFARRTDSGLQPCQTEGGGYGYLGDSDGLVQDSAATNYRAITVGI
ncbi:MAG: hypothetical protein GY841_16625, partial [FCB group bacterium]|nr:hypothetical protein [FCB group bacterium]